MKQKFELDLVLDQELSPKVIDNLLTAIDLNADKMTELIARTFGIDAWFKAYVESEHFSELDQVSKGEALEAYIGLKDFLTRLDNTCQKNNIYAYANHFENTTT